MPDTRLSLIKGKKILFFSPVFFGYEDKIAAKMRELGAKTDFFDVRSVTKAPERALLKINPELFHKKTEAYYARIFSKIRYTRYDYILMMLGSKP